MGLRNTGAAPMYTVANCYTLPKSLALEQPDDATARLRRLPRVAGRV